MPLVVLVNDWRVLVLAALAAVAWFGVVGVTTSRAGVAVRHDYRVIFGSVSVMILAGQVAVASGGRLWICVTASGFSCVAILVLALHHRWLADVPGGPERDENADSLQQSDM
ncbi:hypothetical protein ACFYYL_19225 [Actinomadura geliboluensis]|uniref:hypothetical protein n=1 Tax=Actinomadura geliboluensis TaxID=882440 RepID=UPI0036CCFF4D